jgi:hypothetical protein
MASARNRIDQLKTLRELRRKAASQRAINAQAELRQCEAVLETARQHYSITVDSSRQTRLDRLEAIMSASQMHGIFQAMAVSAYELTQIEIDQARQVWRQAREIASQAAQRAEMAQKELAQSMQKEEKARNLSRNLQRLHQEASDRQS